MSEMDILTKNIVEPVVEVAKEVSGKNSIADVKTNAKSPIPTSTAVTDVTVETGMSKYFTTTNIVIAATVLAVGAAIFLRYKKII